MTVTLPADIPSSSLSELTTRCQVFAGLVSARESGIKLIRSAWDTLAAVPKGRASELDRVVVAIIDGLATHAVRQSSGALRYCGTGPATISAVRASQAIAAIFGGCRQPQYSLGSAAKATGLSRWHLSRVLKAETGYGFNEHLRNARVLIAIVAMSDSRLSLKEIAAQSGFASLGDFDRQFRRLFGMTPSMFRRLRASLSPLSDKNTAAGRRSA